MKFDKSSFHCFGGYLTYGPDQAFVARFKYSRGDKASFVKFLIANFEVGEYFARLAVGETPVGILRSKGWVSPTVLKLRAEQASYNARLTIQGFLGAASAA